MTEPKHLSNKELVYEAMQMRDLYFSSTAMTRHEELKKELLRRLEEPWRNPKVSKEMWRAYNKGKEKTEESITNGVRRS